MVIRKSACRDCGLCRLWLSFQASVYLYCCGRLQGRNYPESAEQSAPPPLRLLCQTVTVTHRIPRNTRKPQQRSVMPENRPITVHTSVHHSLLISNSLLSLYRLTFPVLSWFPTTGTYSAFNNLRKPKKNHIEQITPGAIPL